MKNKQNNHPQLQDKGDSMLKHIGKHGDKKVVVLYREVPNENHMCLLVYSDVLPRIYHDAVMSVLESAVGQQAESLADALFRNMMPDGVNCLEVLHKNGMIKKVNTNQVIMTPTPAASVRLDELNEILNEMKKGEEAIKRLADMDQARGLARDGGSGADRVATGVHQCDDRSQGGREGGRRPRGRRHAELRRGRCRRGGSRRRAGLGPGQLSAMAG